MSGLAVLDTANGRATAVFAVSSDGQGRLSGRLLYADVRNGVLLTGDGITALSVSGDVATFSGTGRCLDRRRGVAGLRSGLLSEDEALVDPGQQAIRQELDRLGQTCAFTVQATDGGRNGQSDAFAIAIDGGAVQGARCAAVRSASRAEPSPGGRSRGADVRRTSPPWRGPPPGRGPSGGGPSPAPAPGRG